MGRSLGSIPAIEVAFNFQGDICGVIIESGTASNFRGMLSYLGINNKEEVLGDKSFFLNKVKIKQVYKPTLIIHGSYDQTISVEEGRELYKSSGAEDKEILVIDGAGHNDVMLMNQTLYFDKITKFIQAYG